MSKKITNGDYVKCVQEHMYEFNDNLGRRNAYFITKGLVFEVQGFRVIEMYGGDPDIWKAMLRPISSDTLPPYIHGMEDDMTYYEWEADGDNELYKLLYDNNY